jgi:hypothetical protein
MNIDNIIEAVQRAPSAILMRSVKHCHALNVSSIVLSENEGRLTRCFMAWPGHQLERNTPENRFPVVGPHTHRYALTLRWVSGFVFNYTMRLSDQGSHPENYDCWKFSSAITAHDGEPIRVPKGQVVLSEYSRSLCPAELSMDSRTIHSMSCSDYSIWVVEEGQVVEENTWLFTPPKSPFITQGFYERFRSPDEVLEHVAKFIREI